MVMMILAGTWAIRTMPSSLDPPAHFPEVFVEVAWVGASAEDIAALVTTPIEQQLRNLDNLRDLYSRTTNGYTFVNAMFNFDAGIMFSYRAKTNIYQGRVFRAKPPIPKIGKLVRGIPISDFPPIIFSAIRCPLKETSVNFACFASSE